MKPLAPFPPFAKAGVAAAATLSNKAQPPEPKSPRLKYCHVLSNWLTTPSMPPIPPPHIPRIVIYYQTQHNPDGTPCSILPIITQPNIAVTHFNVAAIQLNDPPGNISLVRTSPPVVADFVLKSAE